MDTPLSRRALFSAAGTALAAGAGATWIGQRERDFRARVEWPQQGEPSWEDVRSSFDLDPEWVHLSGLLIASHPREVRLKIQEHRQALDANPAHNVQGNREREDEVRRLVGRYMGASSSDIALTHNTTTGLAMLYTGIQIRPNQEILSTTHDHYATNASVDLGAEKSGASVRRISLFKSAATATVEEIANSLRRSLRPQTRIVAVTWVHSNTGMKLPLMTMSRVIAAANEGRSPGDRILFCVDGVHGFGVERFQIADLGCDFFAAGCHKWICGPRGTGIVWGKPDAQRFIRPLVPTFSGTGTWGRRMTPGGFHAFEHRWALGEAFQLHLTVGQQRVAARVHELARQLKEGLAGMSGITVHTPMSEGLSSGIVCFSVRGMSPAAAVSRLRQQRIVASASPYAVSYVRLTPAIFNTPEEIGRALAAVRDL
jgi:isopenicillin-N epimerase